MATKPPIDNYAAEVLAAIPDTARDAASGHQDVVQNVVWIVGLASAFLAFIATKDTWLAKDQSLRVWLAVTLATTVVLGVVQRAVHLRFQHLERETVHKLRFALIGLVAFPEPVSTRQEFWSREEIVRQCVLHFDINLGLPAFATLSGKEVGEIYDQLYAAWQEHSATRATNFLGMMAAAGGKAIGVSTVKEEKDEPHADIRSHGQGVLRWERLSFVLYLATNGCFVAAVLLILRAVVDRS